MAAPHMGAPGPHAGARTWYAASFMGAIPELVGPFRPLSILGRGGMGIVYRAEHVESREVIALKTVLTPAATERARIRDEIQALRSIEHPGVVRIRRRVSPRARRGTRWSCSRVRRSQRGSTSSGSPTGRRTSGRARRRRRRSTSRPPPTRRTTAAEPRSSPLGHAARGSYEGSAPAGIAERPPAAAGKLDEALALAYRLCAPLAFIHGEGLVHRDLKPANVFVLRDGAPVLMDFGIVSRAQGTVGREALEAAGYIVGTAAYVAPEQARGQRVDARADLYALGCTVYEMITGQAPFRGPTLARVLQEHLTATPRPPSDDRLRRASRAGRLDVGLLAKERRERIGYADDVAAVLAGLGARARSREAGHDGDRRQAPARSYLYRPETVGRTAILTDLRVHLEAAVAGRGILSSSSAARAASARPWCSPSWRGRPSRAGCRW